MQGIRNSLQTVFLFLCWHFHLENLNTSSSARSRTGPQATVQNRLFINLRSPSSVSDQWSCLAKVERRCWQRRESGHRREKEQCRGALALLLRKDITAERTSGNERRRH